MRCRPATFHFNFHLNFQVHVCRSRGLSNWTSFHHWRGTPLLLLSALSNSEVWIQMSLCGSQSDQIPSFFFFRDWIASEIAVHEECDFVNVFLSSESYCSSGLPDKIPCCTLQWKYSNSRGPLASEPNVLRFPQGQICLWPNRKASCTKICTVLHVLSSELDSFFRLTPTCLVVSLVVYPLSWCSRCIQILCDEECVSQGRFSMSKNCSV